jgi:hypothetical protein
MSQGPFRSILARLGGVLSLLLLGIEVCRGAGVTIITHGLNGNVDDWVISMANQMTAYDLTPFHQFPGGSSTCYELYFTPVNNGYALTWARIGGSAPTSTDSGEILVKLDWRQLANDNYSTYTVAGAVVPRLLQSSFISELNGHALAELPIHLIGHSRGGSLVCEMSKNLGENGVWVDHLTTLDPHPLNNDIFDDTPFYTVVDAPARTYENVLFHDNYYQWLNLIAYGEPVAGAYIRRLTNLDGGYSDFTASHSDVHLWYHGTIDFRTSANDTVASITSSERQTWWTPYEYYGGIAGFYYSLIGGGDRLSTDEPDGPSTGQIRDGYNQLWDFGAGLSVNRYALPSNNGSWPNLIRLNIRGSNTVAQGDAVSMKYFYQYAQSSAQTATVTIFRDGDFNPYNGNSVQIVQQTKQGTGADYAPSGTATFDTSCTPPGSYAIYARITAGGRSRYLYAPEILTITAPPCAYSLSPLVGRTHTAAAANGSVTVNTRCDCNWTAVSNDGWISITAGSSGTGHGTVSYSVTANADIAPRTGTMTIGGNTFTVTQAPDTTKPTLAIAFPPPSMTRVTSNTVTFNGTAGDDVGVASVCAQTGNDPFTLASGTTAWSASVGLSPGSNVVRIKAVDAAGNAVTNTRTIVYVVTSTLDLSIVGQGMVTPLTNGQTLEVGKTYTVKATPKPGSLFSNWLGGGVVYTDPILPFVMSSNLELVANFVSSPFPALKGAYNGLFRPMDSSLSHENSGFFNLVVTDKGAFTGKLLLAGAAHPVSGKFDLGLHANSLVLRGTNSSLVLDLQLTAGTDQISGAVSNTGWSSDLSGYRAIFNATTNRATNFVGAYTILLSGGTNPVTSPFGQSAATLAVSLAGNVKFAGTLADGSKMAQVMPVSANGQVPTYVRLYRGKGSLLGWLTFTNSMNTDIAGSLLWTKRSGVLGPFYPAGFTNTVETVGSRYMRLPAGTPALGLTDGIVLLSEGNLSATLTNQIAVSALNKISILPTNSNRLLLTLSAPNGLVGGSFFNPWTRKTGLIKGAVIQKQNLAGGFFRGTNECGLFFLGRPEDFPLFAP